MKIYIICDLEGTAGVVDHRQQCWFDGAYYHQARDWATLELNAIVEGALEGGATEIVAWDGHGNFPGGLNIDLLHPACQLTMGAGDGGPAGLDSSFQAMFLCGLHGMARAPYGVLAHSFMPWVAEMTVNGQPWGEIGANCITAGQAGVPTVFICGDWAATQEACALVPGLETVAVKKGLNPVGSLNQSPTLSLSPDKACQEIRAGAKRAMQKIGTLAPFFPPPPYNVRTRFTEAKFADEVAQRPGVQRIDELTVEATFTDHFEPLL